MGERINVEARRRPHWLYRLFDADGALLYVGQTRNPVQRMRGWQSARANPPHAWFDRVASTSWQRFPNFLAVIAAEKNAIEVDRPLYNRQHQPALVA